MKIQSDLANEDPFPSVADDTKPERLGYYATNLETAKTFDEIEYEWRCMGCHGLNDHLFDGYVFYLTKETWPVYLQMLPVLKQVENELLDREVELSELTIRDRMGVKTCRLELFNNALSWKVLGVSSTAKTFEFVVDDKLGDKLAAAIDKYLNS
jgi:hypothetical protein